MKDKLRRWKRRYERGQEVGGRRRREGQRSTGENQYDNVEDRETATVDINHIRLNTKQDCRSPHGSRIIWSEKGTSETT